MIRSGFCVLAAWIIAGCATNKAPADGTQFRADNWALVVDAGFAVAPPLAQPGVTRPAEAAALFANEFYAALLISMPRTQFKPPDQTLELLNESGAGAHARLRSLCGKLYRNDELVHEELVALSRDVQHRFLLVGWIEEEASEESAGGGYYFYGHDNQRGSTESVPLAPLTYDEVNGQAVAVILDLWEDDVLWRGTVAYKTTRNDSEDDDIAEGLDRTRAAAAIRLADCVGEH